MFIRKADCSRHNKGAAKPLGGIHFIWHNWCDCHTSLCAHSSATFLKTISWFVKTFHNTKIHGRKQFLSSFVLLLSPLIHAERLMSSSLLSKSPLYLVQNDPPEQWQSFSIRVNMLLCKTRHYILVGCFTVLYWR